MDIRPCLWYFYGMLRFAHRRKRKNRLWQRLKPCLGLVLLAGVLGVATFSLSACATGRIRPPSGVTPRRIKMETTGYCNCQKCCSWERSWLGLGQPVYSTGASKGKPKKVGVTASGTKAKRGTLAADASVPFGAIFDIPGYGMGRVEDRGGAIKGNKLDLWFPTHQAALNWGRRTLTVTYWPSK